MTKVTNKRRMAFRTPTKALQHNTKYRLLFFLQFMAKVQSREKMRIPQGSQACAGRCQTRLNNRNSRQSY